MIILGLMSGTSLDGIDLALCDIDGKHYSLLAADTVPYPSEWQQRLRTLEHATALEYAKANVELGHLFGKTINEFIKDKNIQIDAIASHGHTIFHQPGLGLTTQIGDGDAIAAETGLPVVSNFRTLDVALGGQGAPLVPIGDELLFSNYEACRLAARLGLDYDPEGENARHGQIDHRLLSVLDSIEYYRLEPPKSLGKEWFVDQFWPPVEQSPLPVPDLLATITHHIAGQIARVVEEQHISTLLITGGGAHNRHLIDTLHTFEPSAEITIPDKQIINYKEAIIFAFLGYLRLTRQVNTLASVTGARCDSIGGNISELLP